MQPIVYADVLVFLNTVITFFLLLTVKLFSGGRTTGGRLTVASLVGGVYSLMMLAPKMHFLLTILAKGAMGVSIVLIAFRFYRPRDILKSVLLFLGAGYLYAGIMYGLNFATQNSFITIRNGTVYFDMSAYALIAVSVVIYAVIFLLRKRVFHGTKEDRIYHITLTFKENTVQALALLDSGNHLKDIYTNQPVMIIRENLAQTLTSFDFSNMTEPREEMITKVPVRLLPVHSLASESVLPAFTLSSAEITGHTTCRTIKNVCAAVTNDELGGEKYQALISDDFI